MPGALVWRHPPSASILGSPHGAGASGEGSNVRLSGDASHVLDDVVVPGLGRFRRFADGHVSVSFDDRTVLTLAAPGAAAAGDEPAFARRRASGRAAPHLTHAASAPVLTTAHEEWYLCRAVLPSGRQTTVCSDNPIGLGPQVAAALAFLRWSDRSPPERIEHDARERQRR
eukprot:scaffold179314_cov32-Tisochrysis_lutea.AAC.3